MKRYKAINFKIKLKKVDSVLFKINRYLKKINNFKKFQNNLKKCRKANILKMQII